MVGGAEVIVRKNIEDLKKNKMKYLLLFGTRGGRTRRWGCGDSRRGGSTKERRREKEGREGREGRGGTLATQHTDANSTNEEKCSSPWDYQKISFYHIWEFKEIYRFDLHLEN